MENDSIGFVHTMVCFFLFNSLMISHEQKEMAILKLDWMEKVNYRKKLYVMGKKRSETDRFFKC